MFKNPKNLHEFVDNANKWRSIWNKAPLSLAHSQDREYIAVLIETELSPENLTCDGELPNNVVSARHAALAACAKELMAMDPGIKFYEFS